MKIKINKKIIFIYLLAFLGLFFILYYIWFRFLRERLPRDIPFDLSIIGFFILLYVCLVYCYLIYRHIKPKSYSETLYKILSILFKPFYYFNKILQKPSFINFVIFRAFFHIIVFFKLYNFINNKYFFIVFNILPKIILTLIFLGDVFYMQNLYLFYNFIILGIFPLLYTYCIFAITKYLEIITNFLDKYYYVKILSTEEEEKEYEKNNEGSKFFVSLFQVEYIPDEYPEIVYSKYFIFIQTCNLIFDHDLYKYTCIETGEARELYAKKHNIQLPILWVFDSESDEISKALIPEFKRLMPMAYYFTAFVETHSDITLPKFKKFNIYILCTYAICWVYILIISFHTLDFKELLEVLNTTWLNIPESFSDTLLNSYAIFFISKIKNKQNILESVKKPKKYYKEDVNIFIYKNLGITEDDINNVLKKHDLFAENDTKNLFIKYKQRKNQQNQNSLNSWLICRKKTKYNKTMELLKQKSNEHENKFK